MYKENTLVFAEVKTRTGAMLDRPRRRGGRPEAEPPDFGGPAIPAAQPLLRCRIRFDVVEVTPAARGWQVHCIPGAFEC